MAAGGPHVLLDGDGAVRQLTLNRPERHNAQTPQMWREMAAAGAALSSDPRVRVVVISGAGASFSSGIDLQEFQQPNGFIARLAAHPLGDPDPMLADIALAQTAFSWIAGAPFAVIAAITGVALGAGLQLALGCDFRFVAHDARLGLLEVTHGLMPDLGATASLPRLVGRERALDLILSGREFDGSEALAMGLALRSVPTGDVLNEANSYATVLARAQGAAIAYTKRCVDEPDPSRNARLAAMGQAACIRAHPLSRSAGTR